MYKLIYTAVFLLAALVASAQNMPERSEVRRGNRQYNKGNYEKSIERYERALEAAPESFEATYNLGNALYKAERFDKAEQTMRKAAADSLRADGERAEAFYVDKVAKEVGSARVANIVLLGATIPFLGIDYEKVQDSIREIFLRKGEAIVEMNLKALAAGKEIAEKLM